MNLFIIPFHDWRKINNEGFRTRDAHLIEHFSKNVKIKNLFIINRPTTNAELLLKSYKRKINGEVIFSRKNLKLIRVEPNLYVIDMILNKSFSQFLYRQSWFFNAFADKVVIDFVKDCMSYLNLSDFNLISHNIYASALCEEICNNKYIFDAYDNLLQFPKLLKQKENFVKSYKLYFESNKSIITTNSNTNIKFFKENFNYEIKHLLSNGVDVDRFSSVSSDVPEDISKIKNPIIGFGGKITHLIDIDLFQFIIRENKNINFVIVGQVLDKDVLSAVINFDNCFYLGDKTYDEYVDYVKKFDIAIVPYVFGDGESGANTIKVYEYIAAGCQIVATRGCGVESLKEFVNIANDKYEFSELIRKLVRNKDFSNSSLLPEIFTWQYISSDFLRILNNENGE